MCVRRLEYPARQWGFEDGLVSTCSAHVLSRATNPLKTYRLLNSAASRLLSAGKGLHMPCERESPATILSPTRRLQSRETIDLEISRTILPHQKMLLESPELRIAHQLRTQIPIDYLYAKAWLDFVSRSLRSFPSLSSTSRTRDLVQFKRDTLRCVCVASAKRMLRPQDAHIQTPLFSRVVRIERPQQQQQKYIA